jgi:hypothetical protein
MPAHQQPTPNKKRVDGDGRAAGGAVQGKGQAKAVQKNSQEVRFFTDMVASFIEGKDGAKRAVEKAVAALRPQEQSARAALGAANAAFRTAADVETARPMLMEATRAVATVVAQIEEVTAATIKPFRENLLARQEREGVYLGRVKPGHAGMNHIRVEPQQEYRYLGQLCSDMVPIKKTIAIHGRSANKTQANIMHPGSNVVVAGGMAAGCVGPGVAAELKDMYTYLRIKTPGGFFDGMSAVEEEGGEGWDFDRNGEGERAEAAAAAAEVAKMAGGGGKEEDDVLMEDL